MRIIQWNVRGYFARLPYLQQLLDEQQPDILCFQETWLKPNKNIRLRNFQNPPSRLDRTGRDGGGVSIHVRSTIPYMDHCIITNLEATASKVYLPDKTIIIISLYIPPDYSNSNLLAELNKLIPQLPATFIITADANAHHTSWGSEVSDNRGNLIDQWVTDNNLIILNNSEPTYIHSNGSFSHIDLSICSSDLATSLNWNVTAHTHNSDHFPIIIDSNIQNPIINIPKKWLFKTADWKGYRSHLKLPNNFITPTEACGKLEVAITSAANNNIKITEGPRNYKYCKSWWTPDCTSTNKNMKHSFNKYKKEPGNLNMWIDFKRKRAIFRHTVCEAKRSSWQGYVESINFNTATSEVWKKVGALSDKSASNKTLILKINDEIISKPERITDILAIQYSRQSSGHSDDPIFTQARLLAEPSIPTFNLNHSSLDYNQALRYSELKKALYSSSSKSAGPDSIPFDLLKEMSDTQKEQLLNYYNFIWNTGFPHQWRNTIIIPILKPGKCATDPTSYRPIALTNCLCKVMEKMINWRLQAHLEEKKYLDVSQSGFRAGHSTLDALSRLESEIRTTLIRDDYCVAVFLDIAKAFDTVWHGGLMQKLHSIGLSGNLPFFIQEFLKLRKITVRVNNNCSNYYPLHSGVPQGSVVSPTLFTIMINDFFTNCPPDIHHSLYADDGAMWVSKQSIEAATSTLQLALSCLEQWSHRWGLVISATKTKAMIFTRRRKFNAANLILNDTIIEYAATYKFLGVTLDRKLTWANHISSVKEKCQKSLRLLSVVSARGWGSDYATLKTLYTSLILPKLDYAGFLIGTAAPSHLLTLDRIQYAAIRTILGVLRCTPVSILEAEANIMPLAIRRSLQMTKFACRVLSVENHPLRAHILNYYPFDIFNHSRFPLPVAGRILNEFRELGISLQSIATIPMPERYYISRNNAKSSLKNFNKDELSDHQWCLEFQDLLVTTYSDRQHIYCDGSVKDQKSGAGIYNTNFKLIARLPDKTSIFTAELFAIYSAISFISTQMGNFALFTDSLSSVSALQEDSNSKHYLVKRISKLIRDLPDNKLIIEWVPSHVGIRGNEAADELAKQAVLSEQITINQLSTEDANRIINEFYYRKWQQVWSSNSLLLTKFKSALGEANYLSLPRRKQICISRLRLRTCLLTHGHHFSKTLRAQCQQCQLPLTLVHLFIQCPALVTARQQISDYCRKHHLALNLDNLLDEEFPPELLLDFLALTNLKLRI